MTTKYLVLGSGAMGEAIAYDLCQTVDPATVTVADANAAKAAALAKSLDCGAWRALDAQDDLQIHAAFDDADVAVSALPYDFNLALTQAAILSRTHLCDLGGNNSVVADQFALNREARDAEVRIVPDCGIAPGAVSIFSQYAIDLLGHDPNYVRIRVGGLPANPQGSFGYAKVFSVHGLVNEYIEPVEILTDGKLSHAHPLSGVETLSFKDIGTLEAAYTSGGSSTLTKSFSGRVKNLDYKTLRYPGHWSAVRAMHELGFFGNEAINVAQHGMMDPRAFTEAMLERALPFGSDDLLITRITVGDDTAEICLEFIDRANVVTGHTAMQRCTGYSAAIIATMLADGRIKPYGVLRQELSVPADAFVIEWKKRGLPFNLESFQKR